MCSIGSCPSTSIENGMKALSKRQSFQQDSSELEISIQPSHDSDCSDMSQISSNSKSSMKSFAWMPFILVCSLALVPVFKYGNPMMNRIKIDRTALRSSPKIIAIAESNDIDVAASQNTDWSEGDRELLKFLVASAIGRSKVRDLIVREYASNVDISQMEDPSDLLEYALGNLESNANRQPLSDAPDSQLPEEDRDLINFVSRSSAGRERVREILIAEFISESSPDTDPDGLLDTAIEAIEISEKDGEPVLIEGYPFLFVGSVGAARNEKSLNDNNITHLVNWSSSAKCPLFPEISYMCIYGVRGWGGLIDHLDEAVDFVESARLSGGKVMSHCWYGKNRSVTLLVAYLMKYGGMGPSRAIKLIQRTRPEADPYWETLMEYKHFLQTGEYNRRMTGHRTTRKN